MLQAKRSPTQEASGETEEAASKDDAGIIPLGIPMLSGPGAISSVMVLVGQAAKLWEWIAILGSIAITAWASYGVLVGADRIRKLMGDTGIRILVRIMGLLLVALAVQFFVNGLTDLGVIVLTAIVVAFTVSLGLSLLLVRSIVVPVRDLRAATERVAHVAPV